MAGNDEALILIQHLTAFTGVRGAMLASPSGALGASEYTTFQPSVAADVSKTVRRMVVASTTANAPLRELLINFGPSRMMVRPLHEDAVLVVMLERDAETAPVREAIDSELRRRQREAEGPSVAVGVRESDDEVGELLSGPLGPILREIEAVYQRYRRRRGHKPAQIRELMYEQIREWLLCCNPSAYTLPLLLDGLSETMADDPTGRNAFVGDVQNILRKAGALR